MWPSEVPAGTGTNEQTDTDSSQSKADATADNIDTLHDGATRPVLDSEAGAGSDKWADRKHGNQWQAMEPVTAKETLYQWQWQVLHIKWISRCQWWWRIILTQATGGELSQWSLPPPD